MYLSEQEIVRRQAREELLELGTNPYPSELFEVNVTTKNIHENYERSKTDYKKYFHRRKGLMSRAYNGVCFIC